MVAPISIANSVGQSIDTIYGPDGASRIKLGVGDKALAGITPHGTWHGVATHQDGDTFVAADGVVVVAGTNSGVARKLLTDALGNLQTRGVTGSLTDRSGSITTGGTAQQMMAANASRHYLFIQNLSVTEDLWFNFTTAAVIDTPSIRLGPYDSFVMETGLISTEVISVIAATTAHKWTAKEG